MSTKDPRKAKQFATRKDAIAAAKAIGWRVNDATAVEVMGFKLYAIADEHMNLLTASEVDALTRDRAKAGGQQEPGRHTRDESPAPPVADIAYYDSQPIQVRRAGGSQ